ncbi:FadR/GntR family transcriptional regulator [Propionivibrio soli]|uniref:FadR/GntR family transcriptional regulator n=1 Tax=Propionivibrio soli TaxID=2976531 RepID=UPI0021E77D7A|nr:FadR/GntR family transcriptional regulator [Propionivibrio soli]
MTKTDRLTQLFGKQITQGAFAPGAALPSEADLCARFAVSRNVMREVIKVLSTKRLIDAQRHRGLFVMPREQWNYLDADVLEWALEQGANPELISSLLEVRSLIEPTISRWAAERATAVDLVAIEASYHDMEASRADPHAFHEADIAFHRAILLATHNLVIQQLSDALSALQRAIFDYTFLDNPPHMELTVKEHGELFDAIRRKNVDYAEQASRAMVTRTAGRARNKPESTDFSFGGETEVQENLPPPNNSNAVPMR